MEELSIGSQLIMGKEDACDEADEDNDGPSQIVVELVRIIPHFRRSTKLELIVPGVDQCYSKHLFGICTNLVHFGVWFKDQCPHDNLFEHIMNNSLNICTIRLYMELPEHIYKNSTKCSQMLRSRLPSKIIWRSRLLLNIQRMQTSRALCQNQIIRRN